MRVGVLALMLLLFSPTRTFAEWQIRPFLGVTFGGSTTFVDLEHAAGGPHVIVGANAALLSDVFGIEVDFAHAPGFFQSGAQHLVLKSGATTLTGNVIIAVPRHVTEYTLGPYFVVGAGLMRAHTEDVQALFSVSRTLPAMDIGGGVTGNLTQRIGLMWDARYFWSVGGKALRGFSLGPQEASEQLSFWRASMALVIRH
jgi:hypothetical protein